VRFLCMASAVWHLTLGVSAPSKPQYTWLLGVPTPGNPANWCTGLTKGGSCLLRECLVGNIFVHTFGFDQPVDDVQNSRIVRIRLRIWKVCENLITACIYPLPNFSFLLHLGRVKTQPTKPQGHCQILFYYKNKLADNN